MTQNIEVRQGRSRLRSHLWLGLLLLFGGAVVAFWPTARTAAWVIVAASVATHLGLALIALFGVRQLISRVHSGKRDPLSPGHTIRWAALYDVLVSALTFGQERAFREATLERAGISPGERVLDVGCGTGTLALAAKRRVGAGGTVHGVDAGAEMVARLCVTRSNYWNESGGGYAVFKLTIARTGSKPFCWTVTGAHPVS